MFYFHEQLTNLFFKKYVDDCLFIFFMTHANGICSGFHYGIFSQIGTVEQGKFVFKHHLYCQDTGKYKNLQVVL